jgi:hypothetical protein
MIPSHRLDNTSQTFPEASTTFFSPGFCISFLLTSHFLLIKKSDDVVGSADAVDDIISKLMKL